MQGVGFRYQVMQIASRFPVNGTVCNLRSGAVEIDVEGEDDVVGAFVDAVLDNLPRHALVDSVKRAAAEPRAIRGFTVRSDR